MIKIESENATLTSISYILNTMESRQLHLPDAFVSTSEFKRLMQGLISRNSENLHYHIQYIHGLLANENSDSSAIYTALLDLFIVLKDKGLALKKRLLALSKPQLSSQEFEFLESNLIAGINRNTVLPEGSYSMLSANFIGRSDFIEKQQLQHGYASAYDEVVSLLEYGDLEQAQALLEQALKEQPTNATIAKELVTIYQHYNDEPSLQKMSQWFMDNNLELPECWPLL